LQPRNTVSKMASNRSGSLSMAMARISSKWRSLHHFLHGVDRSVDRKR
jgi:hypothetical protein